MIQQTDLEEVFRTNPEREIVLEWMIGEWLRYSNPKWGFTGTDGPDDHEESMREDGFRHDRGFWNRQVVQYLDRAHLYSVGDQELGESVAPEKGRQAAMKSLMTLFDGAACMIRQHGLPPAPGQTSGDTEEWQRDS